MVFSYAQLRRSLVVTTFACMVALPVHAQDLTAAISKHIGAYSPGSAHLTEARAVASGKKTRKPNFSGTWRGTLKPSGGSCGVTESVTVSHKVTQRGSSVELRVPAATGAYKGKSDGSKGFTVSGRYTPDGIACSISTAIRYSNVKNNKATVNAAQVIKCDDGSGCENFYRGTLFK